MISKWVVLFITLILVGLTTHAVAESVDEQTIDLYQKQIERLDIINFHPNLLPLILKNSDYLELSPQQLAAFRGWRKTNAKAMFATMNEVIRKRIEFREAVLSPDVSADDLRQKQQEIFALHQKVLDYKLSCRENIHNTFTQQNWDDFFVVLAEAGYAIPSDKANVDIVGLSGMSD